MSPSYEPGEARYLGMCRKCKTPRSALLAGRWVTRSRTTSPGTIYARTITDRHFMAAEHQHGARVVNGGVYVTCSCGVTLALSLVNGKHNPEHGCDARCLNATGPNCECSCSGANHGANHA